MFHQFSAWAGTDSVPAAIGTTAMARRHSSTGSPSRTDSVNSGASA